MQREPPTSPYGILGRALGAGPLGGLKRYLRWFNLTMLQQALWPLLIAVASAPQVDLEQTPLGWFLLRLAGPVLAVVAALIYLRSSLPIPTAPPVILSGNDGSPGGADPSRARPSPSPSARTILSSLVTPPPDQRAPVVATQLRYALLVLPIVVGLLRLIAGPLDETTRIILFGLVNVAAYQVIHFGVVPRSFDYRRQGLLAGAILFGLSWGFHDALMFGLNDGAWLPGLVAGCVLGWLFGFGSLVIRQWPGGALTAAAVQFFMVYLVGAFA